MRPTLAILLGLAAAGWAAEPAPVKDAPKDKTAQSETANPSPFLGIAMDEVDEALAYHLKLDNDLGILVGDVSPGSTAEKMGLKMFDVVVDCDGKPIYTPRALGGLVRDKKVGDAITVKVRRGIETVTLTGTLQARPANLDERPGNRRVMPDMDQRLRRFHDMMPPAPGEHGPGPHRGRVEKPDGSVMEWSIEETEAK